MGLLLVIVSFLLGGITASYYSNETLADKTYEVERQIFDFNNFERDYPLTLDEQASYVARDWSKKMADRASLSHEGFPRAREIVYMRSFPNNECISALAENVGVMDYSANMTPSEVADKMVGALLESRDHRYNMLNPDYDLIGIGVYFDNGKMWVTQLFFRVVAC